jgi:CRP-like cAMP-binding protein
MHGVTLLETAMLSCNYILRIPRSYVRVDSLDAVALVCELTFFVAPIERCPDAQNEVFDRVYRHCASAGVRLAPPPEGSLSVGLPKLPHDTAGVPRRLLERLPIFMPLSDEERQLLAPKMRCESHKTGDVLVPQGVVAGALFILSSGVLAGIQRIGSRDEEVLRFAPGDCFGQASVLTGAKTVFRVQALTSSVVYEIAKTDIGPILKARPAIAAELGQIMARRDAAWKDRQNSLEEADTHPETLAARLAERVKELFGLPT